MPTDTSGGNPFTPKNQFIKRQLTKGLGEAVAQRTILRKGEKWDDVARRVSRGNSSLLEHPNYPDEEELLYKHITNASLLMSGRHLQHGDENQKLRNQEVFTNCSTAATTYILFYLLLNGSGVGRLYDDDMMLVNWDFMPHIRCVLSNTHPDFKWDLMESTEEAKLKYQTAQWYEVSDSREGWAQAVEKIETMAHEKKHKDELLIIDFSKVRENGKPIGGMQNRPASGPGPLMRAIEKLKTIKGAGMSPWKQTMFADHYLAECVLVGGARRAARIAVKNWQDPEISEFINIKQNGFLWSANNSIGVDAEFWKQETDRAKEIFADASNASYHHNTGEPGYINLDKLVINNKDLKDYKDGAFIGSQKYQPSEEAKHLLSRLASVVVKKKYSHIVNPCGEVSLNVLNGYCVIADVVPYFAPTLDDAEEAFRVATRALMRVNTMDSLYKEETNRTNRIGVGMTGLHEFAWKFFKLGFRDLIDEKKSQDFWHTINRFKNAVVDESIKYAQATGRNVPHTNTTMKPAGTTSKLFNLSEGCHLPSMKEYLRWVQFRHDDPLVKKYIDLGYPHKELKTYTGTVIIGFPTQPEICKLRMGEKLVTASQATPDEQYKWLMLLEKYWIVGLDEKGQPNHDTGNQISYTLKYKKDLVSFADFKKMLLKNQSLVKCCSVMPMQDTSAYEYQPEQEISRGYFAHIVSEIKDSRIKEDIDMESLICETGACPL